MSTDFREFNINITCAEGQKGVLSFVNFFQKTKVYAAVSVVGGEPAVQFTPLANYFGDNPVWNFPMRFCLEESELQQDALTLRIELRRKRIFGGDEAIAEAFVRLGNLLNCNDSNLNFMDQICGFSWLLSPAGGRRGILYFSYCFGRTIRATERSDGGGVVAPPCS
ncbi:protein SRC2 [Momordica charantia]|uniref:Protein SRC2 n=1 Tax=Momordica charantia TaxID=3673 RepID=A0A6J1DB07_MOMCH|nr:protein SRC2 [Momordica charantia]